MYLNHILNMKQINPFNIILLVSLLAISLDSCRIIGDIFKAGVWVGILIVVAVIGLILWLVGKAKK
jgi:hypothetical protein